MQTSDEIGNGNSQIYDILKELISSKYEQHEISFEDFTTLSEEIKKMEMLDKTFSERHIDIGFQITANTIKDNLYKDSWPGATESGKDSIK